MRRPVKLVHVRTRVEIMISNNNGRLPGIWCYWGWGKGENAIRTKLYISIFVCHSIQFRFFKLLSVQLNVDRLFMEGFTLHCTYVFRQIHFMMKIYVSWLLYTHRLFLKEVNSFTLFFDVLWMFVLWMKMLGCEFLFMYQILKNEIFLNARDSNWLFTHV